MRSWASAAPCSGRGRPSQAVRGVAARPRRAIGCGDLGHMVRRLRWRMIDWVRHWRTDFPVLHGFAARDLPSPGDQALRDRRAA